MSDSYTTHEEISPIRLCEALPEGEPELRIDLDDVLERSIIYMRPSVCAGWKISGDVGLTERRITSLTGQKETRGLATRMATRGVNTIQKFKDISEEEKEYYLNSWNHHAKVMGTIALRLNIVGNYLRSAKEITDIIVRDDDDEGAETQFQLTPQNALNIAINTAVNKIYFRSFSEGAKHPSGEVFKLFAIETTD